MATTWRVTIGGNGHMREVKLSGKACNVPNAILIGYSKTTARVGDWLFWKDPAGMNCMGRMIGSVVESPNDGFENLKGYVCVLQMADNMSHAHINVINPKSVFECRKIDAEFLSLLASIPINEKTIPRIYAAEKQGCLSNSYWQQASNMILNAGD
jgi:hypothetical protein